MGSAPAVPARAGFGLALAGAIASCASGACGGRETSAAGDGCASGPCEGGAIEDAGRGPGSVDATVASWSGLLGVYGDCSFSNLGGMVGSGGALTLTQSASGTLTAAFGGAGSPGLAFSLEFTPTTGTSATLDPPGQTMPWSEFCFAGGVTPSDSGLPPDPAPTPVTLRLTSGALTYDAETVYVSFVGTSVHDADANCGGSPGAGSVTCSKE